MNTRRSSSSQPIHTVKMSREFFIVHILCLSTHTSVVLYAYKRCQRILIKPIEKQNKVKRSSGEKIYTAHKRRRGTKTEKKKRKKKKRWLRAVVSNILDWVLVSAITREATTTTKTTTTTAATAIHYITIFNWFYLP